MGTPKSATIKYQELSSSIELSGRTASSTGNEQRISTSYALPTKDGYSWAIFWRAWAGVAWPGFMALGGTFQICQLQTKETFRIDERDIDKRLSLPKLFSMKYLIMLTRRKAEEPIVRTPLRNSAIKTRTALCMLTWGFLFVTRWGKTMQLKVTSKHMTGRIIARVNKYCKRKQQMRSKYK